MQRLVWGAGRQRALLRSCPPLPACGGQLLLILRSAEPTAVLLRHCSLSSLRTPPLPLDKDGGGGPRSEVLGGAVGRRPTAGDMNGEGPRRRPCLAPMQRTKSSATTGRNGPTAELQ